MVAGDGTGILLVAGNFVEVVAGNVVDFVAGSFVEADAVVGHAVALLHSRSTVVVPEAVDEVVELPALVPSMDEASVVVEQEYFPRNPARHPYWWSHRLALVVEQ